MGKLNLPQIFKSGLCVLAVVVVVDESALNHINLLEMALQF